MDCVDIPFPWGVEGPANEHSAIYLGYNTTTQKHDFINSAGGDLGACVQYDTWEDAYGLITHTSIEARWQANGNPGGPDGTEYLCWMVGDPDTNSGWTTDLSFTFEDLTPSTEYQFRVMARNHDQVPTDYIDLPPQLLTGRVHQLLCFYYLLKHMLVSRLSLFIRRSSYLFS